MVAVLDGTGAVREQYAWDPYGTPAAVDIATALPPPVTPLNRVGHHGLFFERFCVAVTDSVTDRVLGAGSAADPGPVGLYCNRNRWYSPGLGRFLSRDPDETALPVLTALAWNGQALDLVLSPFDLLGQYGDGLNLFEYLGSNPPGRRDALGLEWHHLYPLYLGGGSSGPGIELDYNAHRAFHDELARVLGGGRVEAQRAVWQAMSPEARKLALTYAAQAAGIDVSSREWHDVLELSYESALKHGEASPRRSITRAMQMSVPQVGRVRAYIDSRIGRLTRAGVKGLAVGTMALDCAVLAPLLSIEHNVSFLEIAKATSRARSAGGLSVWDEAFALSDFADLTQEPVSAMWAWNEWGAGL